MEKILIFYESLPQGPLVECQNCLCGPVLLLLKQKNIRTEEFVFVGTYERVCVRTAEMVYDKTIQKVSVGTTEAVSVGTFDMVL